MAKRIAGLAGLLLAVGITASIAIVPAGAVRAQAGPRDPAPILPRADRMPRGFQIGPVSRQANESVIVLEQELLRGTQVLSLHVASASSTELAEAMLSALLEQMVTVGSSVTLDGDDEQFVSGVSPLAGGRQLVFAMFIQDEIVGWATLVDSEDLTEDQAVVQLACDMLVGALATRPGHTVWSGFSKTSVRACDS